MTAGIKQRMAAIIDRHSPTGYEGCVDCWCDEQFAGFAEHAFHVADSIVESLALKREDDGDSHRYSTDWES